MSTIDRERSRVIPPLVAGERLDRATFHERYEAMPPETRAELIGGVVVMMSPMRNEHGDFTRLLSGWLWHYQLGVRGLKGGDASTVLLAEDSEPEPDLNLRMRPEYGGQTRIEDGYIAGAPELIIEVARSTKATDLGPKRIDYERAGVLEYVVVTLDPDEVHWFVRRGDRFAPLPPGPNGIYRSEVFPGLWLDPKALFAEDVDALLVTLERGKATPEHAAFAAALAARGPGH
jgi:Uma2 family endonuclease